ncbi:MAG: FliM/FliN family flagellar motor switch protein [Acidobacteriota bacterium]|nr:FliM/FliN family flagellar motor switch protein [Acidobacteriota bacterium]MDQ7088956.1 FliM/FliN family flagellar motor switch protein [Acidobacteriota bacterium]
MAKAEKQTSFAALFDREEFHALPLNIAARLAEGRVTLASLRMVESGSLIPLETQVGEPSHLIADGAVIGRGEIVEIKGQLAFRVTRLGHKS